MPPKRKSVAQKEPPAKKQRTVTAKKKPLQATKASIANTGSRCDVTSGSGHSRGPGWLLDAQYLQEPGWKKALDEEFRQPYFQDLEKQLAEEYKSGKQIFPPENLIFNAFNLTPFDQVKLVILGQDPYHDDGQAHGLSFSVPNGIKVPPSLANIYKELATDIPGFKAPGHGNLESWARQGVLLVNATLTVEVHKPNSHAKFGWQRFTDAVIKTLSRKRQGVVFILWGGFAHKKEKLIEASKHDVIKTAHPSPLSVTKFMGCKCFSKANQALKKYDKQPIQWNL